MTERDIYDPSFIVALFDEMSKTYGVVNYVSSLGFCERWRRRAVDGIRIAPDAHVVEMMSGSGECWRFFERRLGSRGRLVCLDVSNEMCRRARENRDRFRKLDIEIMQVDALASGLPDGCADHVVACFGLKTFSGAQLEQLAREVTRLLKPKGSFSFVEIAVPPARWFRALYLFYVCRVIPLIGRCFLGNPENYRMLGVYTRRFGSGEAVHSVFEAQGFEVRSEALFFGCARRVIGSRDALPELPRRSVRPKALGVARLTLLMLWVSLFAVYSGRGRLHANQ